MPTIDCALQPSTDEKDNGKTAVVFAALLASFLMYSIKNKFRFLRRSRSEAVKD